MALIDIDYFNQQMKTLGVKSSFTLEAEGMDVLLAEASTAIEDMCNRVLDARDVTDKKRGSGKNRLILEEWPINSVESIDWEDDGGTTGTIDPDVVRILPGGIIEFETPLVHGPWYTGRTYTVVYNAGYTTAPGPLKRATALKVVDLLQPMFSGARDARQVEMITDIEGKIIDLVNRYRRERIG